ncbi:MAG: hypothetical protein Q9205_005463 [Flavoplaca limonia]
MRFASGPIFLSLFFLFLPSLAVLPFRGFGKWMALVQDTRCYKNHVHVFPREDFIQLAHALFTDDPDHSHKLSDQSVIHFQYGMLRVCVYNAFIVQDTHITRKKVGLKLWEIYQTCCQDEEDAVACAGGYAQAKGDNDLFLDVRTLTDARACAWGEGEPDEPMKTNNDWKMR